MTLIDLHASFANFPDRGLMLVMRCPQCNGKHGVGVPVTVGRKEPGRWMISSTDLNTLTMEPSILHNWPDTLPADQKCPYHFRIVAGQIMMC